VSVSIYECVCVCAREYMCLCEYVYMLHVDMIVLSVRSQVCVCDNFLLQPLTVCMQNMLNPSLHAKHVKSNQKIFLKNHIKFIKIAGFFLFPFL